MASLAAPAKWMKRRYNSKIEDMAYCLLGVFDVQMPLVYDERTNAWSRLEEAVSKKYKEEVTSPKPDLILEYERSNGRDHRSRTKPALRREISNSGFVSHVQSGAPNFAQLAAYQFQRRIQPEFRAVVGTRRQSFQTSAKRVRRRLAATATTEDTA